MIDGPRLRIRRLTATAIAGAVSVWVVYVLAVRTRAGQKLDGVAFDRRLAVTAAMTRRTDRLLGTISVASLCGFGVFLILVALALRRRSLAVAVAVAVGGSVITTELLKLVVLGRPELGNYGGVDFNTYPSGHATIGMALSLGLVMVAPRRLGRTATVVAALTAAAFGTAVLSSGWHRPSDTIGAYLVCLAWFCAVGAASEWYDGRHADTQPPDPRASVGLQVVAWVGVAVVLAFALRKSVGVAGLRTVVFAAPYVLACLGIDAVGVGVVGLYYLLHRSSLGDRRFATPSRTPPGGTARTQNP